MFLHFNSTARFARAPLVMAGVIALTSCGQSGVAPVASTAGSLQSRCYRIKVNPTPVTATITFYGWPDNSPPGNSVAHPVIHQHAGGNGTYCNPTTFATERSNNERIPYGIKLYIPFLKQYFIREDLCAASGPRSGSGSNGCSKLWFDLWIGGTAESRAHDVIKCELALTPNQKVRVILYPRDGMAVAHPGAIYRNAPPPHGSCYGKPQF